MTKTNKNNSKKITKKINENKIDLESNHINNMVGVGLTFDPKNTQESPYSSALESISKKSKFSRVLLDLFAVSLVPKITKNGWKVTKKFVQELDKNTLTTKEYDKVDWIPKGQLKVVLPEEFFEYFEKTFSDLVTFDGFNEIGGGGGGFNIGRKYAINGSKGFIQFRYFDPARAGEGIVYASGSAEANYIRQKISMKISGDGLQELRNKNTLVRFLKRLYLTFDCETTMFDATCDMFNYGLKPDDFIELYKKEQYTGRSKVNSFGDVFNPTAYIGAYKGARTIMLYDKLQESHDKGQSDEPEIIKALEECKGDWFRLEQHFSRDQNEAAQAFNEIMFDIVNSQFDDDIEAMFYSKLSNMLKQFVSQKCRFLSTKRKDRNNTRIKTHKKWQTILDVISDTQSDFAFSRPVLTLEERKNNFMYRSIGGNNLFKDIIKEEGYEALTSFLNDVAEHAKELLDEENIDNSDWDEYDNGYIPEDEFE